MESYSSSSNSSDNSDNEDGPSRSKFVHSWSSKCKESKANAKPRPTGPVMNSFKNDGSFLEMFKKMQEQNTQCTNDTKNASNSDDSQGASTNALPCSGENNNSSSTSKTNKYVGKRRPARVLPTGLVKKQRKGEQKEEEVEEEPKIKNDPWLKYMDEVKKYKQQSCTDEESTRRPLVK